MATKQKAKTSANHKRWCGATLQLHHGKWRIRYWLTEITGERRTSTENTGKTDKDEAKDFLNEWWEKNGFNLKTRAAQIQYLAGEQMGLDAKAERIEAKKRAEEESKQAEAAAKADYAAALNVADAFDAYSEVAERMGTGAGTMRSYRSQFNVFANWLAANHPEAVKMRDVSVEVVGDFMTFLTRQRSSATYNKYKIFFRTMWNVLAGKIKATNGAGNPWYDKDAAPKKKTVNHKRKILTFEGLATIIGTATGELRTLFAIGTYTGLRLGDAATLKWEEVDLVLGVITRVPLKTAGETNNEPVQIDIHPVLANILMQAPTYAERKGPVMPEMCEAYNRDKSAVSYRVQSHFRKCGFETASEVGDNRCRKGVDYGFHSLRSTFVTHIVRGVKRQSDHALTVAGSMAGHTTTKMTERYNFEDFDQERKFALLAMPDLTDAKAVALSIGNRADAAITSMANFTDAELVTVAEWISKRLARNAKPLEVTDVAAVAPEATQEREDGARGNDIGQEREDAPETRLEPLAGHTAGRKNKSGRRRRHVVAE